MRAFDRSKIVIRPTKVFYLKMEHAPNGIFRYSDLSFEKMPRPTDINEYLKYYETVGFEFNWLDRLVMPKNELEAKINAPNVQVQIFKYRGEPAGFLELVIEPDYVELLYFGLFPQYIGKGLGQAFLQLSVQQAWSHNPKWIQLNTCELDHENALPNYRKMGFVDYAVQSEERKVMD